MQAVQMTTCGPFDIGSVQPRAASLVVDILFDLCADLGSEDRYRRLLKAIRAVTACDSAAILALDGKDLVPVATTGLVPEAQMRRFSPSQQPRLAKILRSSGPVRFGDVSVPDPFDGLLDGWEPRDRVHACMGAALRIRGEVIGALTLDACNPHAFDHAADEDVALLAALTAATVHTNRMLEQLRDSAARAEHVASELLRGRSTGAAPLVGQSAAMRALRHEIELCAPTDLAVLLTGETGVGKELVAHAIHAASRRATRPLVHVNCAALPPTVAESELFGHVRGAFTGATDHRVGKLELADGGTLFLDEIGELPLELQPKLLRALQSGEIQRVGSDKALHVDVRLIAATNRDLAAEVAAGRFRSDLFHRLAVYPLHVPALRDRPGDVALLAGHFLQQAEQRLGVGALLLSQAARQTLDSQPWPGNVRELEHVILRAAVRAAGEPRAPGAPVVIDVPQLGIDAPRVAPATNGAAHGPLPTRPLREAVDDYQRDLVTQALTESDGNWAEAARKLGLDRGNLHRLARRLGLVITPAAARRA